MSIKWVNICKIHRTVLGIQWALYLLATVIFTSPKAPSRIPQKVLGYMTMAKIRLIKTWCWQVYGKTATVNGNVNWSDPLEGNCSAGIYIPWSSKYIARNVPYEYTGKVHQQNYLKMLTKMSSPQNWKEL